MSNDLINEANAAIAERERLDAISKPIFARMRGGDSSSEVIQQAASWEKENDRLTASERQRLVRVRDAAAKMFAQGEPASAIDRFIHDSGFTVAGVKSVNQALRNKWGFGNNE